jgi:hypothetical protein
LDGARRQNQAHRSRAPGCTNCRLSALALQAARTIARLLGISRPTATKRIRHAAERIASEVPELWAFLKDRRQAGRTHTLDNQPLEHGWLCTDSAGLAETPGADPHPSTAEPAAVPDVHPKTFVQHCSQGRYPAARRDGARWRIPASAIDLPTCAHA